MKPISYLITEGKLTKKNFQTESEKVLRIIRIAVEVGISLIQIREKNLSARLLLDLTKKAVEMRGKSPTKILLNDRVDIAVLAGADGVHLPSTSIPTEVIRRHFPKPFLFGVSCHDYLECENAMKAGADFVTFGPVFSTPGKGFPKGLQALSDVAEKLKPFPVLGLGGITQQNYQDVLKVCRGFAAIRFLNDEENLKKYAESLHDNCRT